MSGYILMSKKGVIEMMETFMILFVIFVLIGIGMYFFYKFSISSTKETAKEACMLTASEMLSSVLTTPELQCTHQSSPKSCVDAVKILAFKNSSGIRLLKKGPCKKKIVFQQVYPQPGKNNNTECDANSMRSIEFPTNCGKWTLVVPDAAVKGKAERIISTPVSLYYPNKKEYGIGKLVLSVYT